MAETSRICGPCSMCCKVMAIPELNKPLGAWCANCTPPGNGCAIYEARPRTCRNFTCNWLHEPTLPDRMRPDRSKVVLSASCAKVMIAYCDPADPLAWRREPAYSILKRRAGDMNQPIVIAVRAGSRMWVVRPGQTPDIDVGYVDPLSPVRFDAAPGGGIKPVVLPPTTQG